MGGYEWVGVWVGGRVAHRVALEHPVEVARLKHNGLDVGQRAHAAHKHNGARHASAHNNRRADTGE